MTKNAVFGKNYRKYKKSQRYKAYNNWSKIDKYEYFTGEENLSSNQSHITDILNLDLNRNVLNLHIPF